MLEAGDECRGLIHPRFWGWMPNKMVLLLDNMNHGWAA